MSKSLCTSCGYIGETKIISKGSIDTEIILWFCFLIPGVIYSIWRYRSQHEVCPICNQSTIIPADSPKAQQIIYNHRAKKVATVIPEFRPPSKAAIGLGRTAGRFIGRFIK